MVNNDTDLSIRLQFRISHKEYNLQSSSKKILSVWFASMFWVIIFSVRQFTYLNKSPILNLHSSHYLHLSVCRIGSSLWPLSSARVSNPLCITNMARFSFTAKAFNYLFLWLLCHICACHHSLWTKICIIERYFKAKQYNHCTLWLMSFLQIFHYKSLFPQAHIIADTCLNKKQYLIKWLVEMEMYTVCSFTSWISNFSLCLLKHI